MSEFNQHELSWTKEKVNNFWNYFVNNKKIEGQSYAKEVGGVIVEILDKYLKEDGKNLDYGCGGGNFMEFLFKNKIYCSGIDLSRDSVQLVKDRFDGNKYFKNVYLSREIPNTELKDESFDFIFSLEVLEHLIGSTLEEVLDEMYRLLKPGGFIFITVPNNEKLDKYKVICPDCGATFHRVQHVNSFSEEGLTDLMKNKGFEKVFSKQTMLQRLKSVFSRAKFLFNLLELLFKKKKIFNPHLIYLGKKK